MSSANQLNGQTHARLIISNQRQSNEKQQGVKNLPKISNAFDESFVGQTPKFVRIVQ